jgi:osmoprotectant transport system ATP-binding protein
VGTVPELLDWDEDRIEERVTELLELMDMPPSRFREQYPRELSGGQRQRVGVARALAADPDVLLMDEPFGALDPITRENLQDEFLDIQEQIDTTILFVTHDIDEALKMGDRIALFDVGELVQYASPRELLENPKNQFVRDFIGSHRALKKLQVTPVKEVMKEDIPDQHEEMVHAIANGEMNGAEPLSPTDSTQVALSQLIGNNLEALPVVKDGEVVAAVTEPAIRGREMEAEGD